MDIPNESVIKKSKRLTSVVWNHFERVRKAEICYAVCVHCNKKLSGSSNSGTTHLRNHLMRCLKRSNFDVSQLLSAKRRRKENTLSITNISFEEGVRKDENISPSNYKFDIEPVKDETTNLRTVKFDQDRSRRDLARMIILHGYPLAMIEDAGFKIFVRNLQPLFDVGSVELACLEIHEKEKHKVFEMLNKLQNRINLAVDLWTSPKNLGYLSLTVHFVDWDWKLQQRRINFITLDSSHTEEMLAEVVANCLMDWNVGHKVFSVTYDDCFTNDDVILGLKDRFIQQRPLLGHTKVFDVRCAAHVLKVMVQDVIDSIRDVVHKIRESVRYVKISEEMLQKFKLLVQQAGIESQKSLCLDHPLMWRSTYLMLEACLEYKDAFFLLQDQDPAFTTVAPSEKEWEWVGLVVGYLRLVVEITSGISKNRNPTPNVYFSEICDVHVQLIEWCKCPNGFLSSLALKMKEKFDQYWNKCSLVLAVAAVLDPRFKMKVVEYYYPQIYGSDAPDRIRDVSDGIKEVFDAYTECSTLVSEDQASPVGSCDSGVSRDRLKGFDKFLHETSQSQSMVSDLEKYLEEPIFPRNFDFNILNWWKVHMARYPVLSLMARDVLGIPMATVALDAVFGVGGKVLDESLSLLDSDMRQALICTQDWLRVEVEGNTV